MSSHLTTSLISRVGLPSAHIYTDSQLGERLFTREDVRPYFELGCIDIIQPDIAHAGGISETKKIATMAEAYDIGVAPHCPLGPLAFAASLHVGFSTPNFVICEMSWKVSIFAFAVHLESKGKADE